MRFIATADTDIGISKKTNQDSVLVKHGMVDGVEVLMAIVCDGMGGLSKGEVASATVIKRFSRWFDEELPYEIDNLSMSIIGAKWALLLKELNSDIFLYASRQGITMGTTFTGILFVDDQYVVAHVGDTRLYRISDGMFQMTEDHTFIARELKKGTITPEQAKTDKRRNLLLQCVGASDKVDPQTIVGRALQGVYMICSDGFRHEVMPNEMLGYLNYGALVDKETMHRNGRYLIEVAKQRGEKDNISVLLIKAD